MSDNSKDRAKELKKKLFYDPENGYDRISPADRETAYAMSTEYSAFLDLCKTETECVEYSVRLACKAGFRPYTRGMRLNPGDKVYSVNREKSIILAVIGKESLSNGVNIVGAHIDSPRIDVRTIPLYEDSGMCLFKTHYYGGIKKYQWTSLPLELRGVIVKKDGAKIQVSVGSSPNDPIFTITDLLPHLASDQMKKSLYDAFTGESLNVIAGTIPSISDKDGSERIKLAVMEQLFEIYGITEHDFISADLYFVPAVSSRDVGFDRSLIGAYGHDDRVCAYTALQAIIKAKSPEKTSVCLLADKEETGSDGTTGMQSRFFDTFIEDLCASQGALARQCMENSACLSADVSNAFDPNYPEVSDKRNDSRINLGAVLTKYTGSRGKYGTSEADADFVSKVRNLFDRHNVIWQTGQLGKVDQGGGGTIAKYMANRNIDTVDMGVPVLSMHSPFEVISKLDFYMAFRAFFEFYSHF
ncbi:MAG: aminopeptidase [Bacillota bacterium]|nr:aminopeptidase [Bacillota bacterium]